MSGLVDELLAPFLERQGVLVLDGGLATELEARGRVLADQLWSARLLLDEPGLIRQVHHDFLEAGADCVTSASYQATLPGLARRGLDRGAAVEILRLSVSLAVEAREAFWSEPRHRAGRLRPLVAASVGPYGAFLADGSEYTGLYDLDEDGLLAFHAERFHALASSAADLLACETIPSAFEARALRRLLGREPGTRAWLSFSCGPGGRLPDGTPLSRLAAELEDCPQVLALGVNCTAPRHVPAALESLRVATRKPLVAYPNSGEVYDARAKAWRAGTDATDPVEACVAWRDRGARLIGGCCRVGPARVRAMRSRLLGHADASEAG